MSGCIITWPITCTASWQKNIWFHCLLTFETGKKIAAFIGNLKQELCWGNDTPHTVAFIRSTLIFDQLNSPLVSRVNAAGIVTEYAVRSIDSDIEGSIDGKCDTKILHVQRVLSWFSLTIANANFTVQVLWINWVNPVGLLLTCLSLVLLLFSSEIFWDSFRIALLLLFFFSFYWIQWSWKEILANSLDFLRTRGRLMLFMRMTSASCVNRENWDSTNDKLEHFFFFHLPHNKSNSIEPSTPLN